MAKYEVTVRFTGKIDYVIEAASEEEAKAKAEDLADEEDRLGALEDIDWEARSACPL